MKIRIISVAILSIIFFNGCLKDKLPNDFSGLTPVVEILYGGLEYFDNQYVVYSADTVEFNMVINIASVNTPTSNADITIDIKDDQRLAYNAANGENYELFPSDAFIFTRQTVTIAAGTRQVTVPVKFLKSAKDNNLLDPKKNYMLPIGITDASGITISDNFGTNYYHIIGNCIAGPCIASGTLTYYIGSYLDNNSVGSFNIGDFAPDKVINAESNTVANVDYSTSGGASWRYVITVDCTNDSITNIVPNDIMYSGIKLGSWKWINAGAPKAEIYDPVAKTIHIISKYATSSGNDRVSDEILTFN